MRPRNLTTSSTGVENDATYFFPHRRSGVLADSSRPCNSYPPRLVFDRFTHPMGNSPLASVVIDITSLRRVVHTMLAVEADADGWRVGAYESKPLWLVPNEVSGLTLMFPEEY